MSRQWQVDFIDKGSCEIVSIRVECYRAYNAPKVALKKLDDDDVNIAKQVDKECVQIKVTEI